MHPFDVLSVRLVHSVQRSFYFHQGGVLIEKTVLQQLSRVVLLFAQRRALVVLIGREQSGRVEIPITLVLE